MPSVEHSGLTVIDLGYVDYLQAWRRQQDAVAYISRGERGAALFVCRHAPVITLGRGAKRSNILSSPEELRRRGIAVYETQRGGDVTYHGPGQLTVYPVLDLRDFRKDLHWYLRELEQAGMEFLSDFGVNARRRAGATGIWAGDRKISSIGIAVKNWITCHGITVNILAGDMQNFRLIRPCGMDICMTSLETESGCRVPLPEARNKLIASFVRHFDAAVPAVI